MSHKTYSSLLAAASEFVSETAQTDEALTATAASDRAALQPLLSELRVRYTLAVRSLDLVHDQLCQPQKRTLVRRLLDSCLGRLLELKHDLVEFHLSDFTYDDDEVLQRLGTSPLDAEPIIPEYFRRENAKELKYRRDFVVETLRKLGFEEPKPQPLIVSEQQAVLIIQVHERARQGRLRGQFMKEIRLLKEKSRVEAKGETTAAAATLIQKVWRGCRARKETRLRKERESLLIGMIPPPFGESKAIWRAEEVKQYRRKLQVVREKDLEEAMEEIEKKLKAKHSNRLLEQMSAELRRWITEYYEKTGRLPDMPSEDGGGSRTMFSRQGTGTGTDSALSKSTPGSGSKESKKSKDKDKDKKSKSSEGKPKEEEDEFGYKCISSAFLPEVINANEEYEDIWKFKDEIDNPHEKPLDDMIEKEKMSKIEEEIRKVVDDIMRGELELLQAAVDRDRAHKGKKPKKQQKKTRRGGKKSKKKREKDLTPDRTTESLFEELVSNGIIKHYPEVRIDSYIGEKCFIGADMRQQGTEPKPCLGDIRTLIKEFCILPLGSEYVHQNSPIVRSVLISGPKGSGKKMLVHAICTELGAVLFDLTPANIVGKYPGKTGLIMLLHLVNKVSRLLQPSVIWMDDAEKPFMKKIPKTDKTDPKRLKKDLVKIIKGICNEDRLIFVGTTRAPWDADQKLLLQCYSKLLLIPRADYGSISLLWRDRFHRTGALNPRLDISCLSRVCDSYTIGSLLEALNGVLTTKRRLQLRVRALTAAEVAAQLCFRDPVFMEQDQAAETWWNKTPLEKRRQKAIQRLEELRLEAEEQAATAQK